MAELRAIEADKPVLEAGEYEVRLSPEQLAELARRGEWLCASSLTPITLEAAHSRLAPPLRVVG